MVWTPETIALQIHLTAVNGHKVSFELAKAHFELNTVLTIHCCHKKTTVCRTGMESTEHLIAGSATELKISGCDDKDFCRDGSRTKSRSETRDDVADAELSLSTATYSSSQRLFQQSDSYEVNTEITSSGKSERFDRFLSSTHQRFVSPFVGSFSGSNLLSFTWAFILIVAFLMLIWTSEITKRRTQKAGFKSFGLVKGHLELVLITLMSFSLAGMVYSFVRSKDEKFVVFTGNSENTNSYLLGGMYLFGAGTLFLIIQRLQIFPHKVVEFPDVAIQQNKQSLSSSSLVLQYNATNSSQPSDVPVPGSKRIISSWVEIFYSAVRLLFTCIQILFLQTFWKSTFNNSRIMKFLFVHIIATNICIWLLYVAEETHIFEHSGHSANLFPANSTKDAIVEIAQSFAEYLIPFTLEYSLITAGILYGMAREMKDLSIEAAKTDTTENNSPQGVSQVDGLAMGVQSLSKKIKQSTISAQPGLLIGLLFSIVLLTSALSLKDNNPEHREKCLIFFFCFQILIFFSHLVCLLGIIGGLQSHQKVDHTMRPDDWLLVIGMLGGVGFDIPVIIAASGFISSFQPGNGSFEWNGTMAILLTSAVLTFVVRVLQMLVIILSHEYKCLRSNEVQIFPSKMIGQLSLFVLVTNLGLWALDSFFELKDFASTSYPCGEIFYGQNWKTIISLTLPFCIFFRFHSAAMIFDLWAKFKFSANTEKEDEVATA